MDRINTLMSCLKTTKQMELGKIGFRNGLGTREALFAFNVIAQR